jgi:hypothetical protein
MLNSQQRHQRDLYQIALAHTGDGHERKTIGKHKPKTKLEKKASDRIWGRGGEGDFENLMECIAITYNKASGQKEKKATERRGEHLDESSCSHTTLEFLLRLKLVPTKADEEDMSLKTATD